jgi:hypothetical protein
LVAFAKKQGKIKEEENLSDQRAEMNVLENFNEQPYSAACEECAQI